MKEKIIKLLQYYYDCVFLDSSSEAVAVTRDNIFKVDDDLTKRKDKKLSDQEIDNFEVFKKKQKSTSSYWYGYSFIEANKNKIGKPLYSPIFYGLFNCEDHKVDDLAPKINYQILKDNFEISVEEIKKISEQLELDSDETLLSYTDLMDKFSKFDIRFEDFLKDRRVFKIGSILASESSQYTIGLEKEYKRLIKLVQYDPSILSGTSLEALFDNKIPENNIQEIKEDFFYEPFKLDSHQRKAVKSSFEKKITIITGPPGTGKSQVVSSIIINSILNGKNVLFASKNNKAIDVVTNRINDEFQKNYPLIFRLGGKNPELIHWLKLINNSAYLPKKIKELDHHKNNLQKKIDVGEEIKKRIYEIIISRKEFNKYLCAYEKINGKNYLDRIVRNNKTVKKSSLINPKYRIAAMYLKFLQKISRENNIENLSEEAYSNREEISQLAKKYVKKWQEIYPNLIDINAKKEINTFIAIKEQLLKGDLPQQDFLILNRQLEELMPKVVKFFRAWSVTNLSIYGRISLVPKLFDLLIIDEATQNDIASALPLLFRAKRAVIIGDPNQLPHISRLETKESRKFLINKHGLKENFWNNFEYTTQSLYAVWNSLFPQEVIILKDHYRSHQDIIGFSNSKWYRNELEVCTDYRKLVTNDDGQRAMEWIDVNGCIDKASKSYYNTMEIDVVIRKIEELRSGSQFSIGIVTPYREQANRINIRLQKILSEDDFLTKRIYADTIHGYQGDEKDIMVFSLVVSDLKDNTTVKMSKIDRTKMRERILSFFKQQGNLINVALTRARSRLFIIGNKEFCRSSGSELLEDLVEYCEKINKPEVTGEDPFESEEEEILYKKMSECGILAIPQYKFNQYRFDFAIVNHEKNLQLCVEVDGKQHAKGFVLDPEQLIKYDVLRNQRLHYYGWKVLRFWTYEIRDNIDECIKKINRHIT
jgi:superfamily I DNA and/or RNA helicase/very-short-patch-repair endonuclease